jgi:hypothetical protein
LIDMALPPLIDVALLGRYVAGPARNSVVASGMAKNSHSQRVKPMPGGGSKPGERRGGRPKGGLNKRTIERQKAFAEARVATKADDFDSVDQMRAIAKYFMATAATERKKGAKANRHRIEELYKDAHGVLRDLARYEHPQLSALKVGGDPNEPLNLSGLSDDELVHFRRLMIKIDAATGVGHAHSSRRQNARLHVVDREFGTTR